MLKNRTRILSETHTKSMLTLVNDHSNILFKLLFYSTLAAIPILAMLPSYRNLPELFSFNSYLNHIFAFMMLYLLFELAYPEVSTKNRILLIVAAAFLIEIIQIFSPTRSSELIDVAADVIGLIAGILLLKNIQKLPMTRHFYN